MVPTGAVLVHHFPLQALNHFESANARRAETTAIKLDFTSSTAKKGERDWTADEIRRLRSLLTRPAARTMMDLACEQPGRRVTFGQVVATVGCERSEARGDLAALTKLIRKRFRRELAVARCAKLGGHDLRGNARGRGSLEQRGEELVRAKRVSIVLQRPGLARASAGLARCDCIHLASALSGT